MLLLHSHYRHHHHHQLQYHVGGAVVMQLEESQSFLVQKQPETKGLQIVRHAFRYKHHPFMIEIHPDCHLQRNFNFACS